MSFDLIWFVCLKGGRQTDRKEMEFKQRIRWVFIPHYFGLPPTKSLPPSTHVIAPIACQRCRACRSARKPW